MSFVVYNNNSHGNLRVGEAESLNELGVDVIQGLRADSTLHITVVVPSSASALRYDLIAWFLIVLPRANVLTYNNDSLSNLAASDIMLGTNLLQIVHATPFVSRGGDVSAIDSTLKTLTTQLASWPVGLRALVRIEGGVSLAWDAASLGRLHAFDVLVQFMLTRCFPLGQTRDVSKLHYYFGKLTGVPDAGASSQASSGRRRPPAAPRVSFPDSILDELWMGGAPRSSSSPPRPLLIASSSSSSSSSSSFSLPLAAVAAASARPRRLGHAAAHNAQLNG